MKQKKKKVGIGLNDPEISEELTPEPFSGNPSVHAPMHFQKNTSVDKKNQKPEQF